MGDGTPDAVFELSDGTGEQAGTELLGLWTASPGPAPATGGRPAPGGVAFDVSAAAAQEPVWRVNLPADPDEAEAYLHGAEDGLETSQQALDAATERIDALVKRQTAQVAFDTSAATAFAVGAEMDEAERALLGLLEEAETGRAPVSYGLGDELAGGLKEATEQFQGFMERARQVVAYYAWVETRVQGQLLGRTSVGWTGNMHTAWQEGPDAAQMALHQRTLALSLASRETLVRTFVVVASGAAKLSVLLSAPGGALLAIPAAWKFINQVRDEIERHQRVTRDI